MAFTSSELTKLSAKVLAAGVISGENNKQYYEASLANIVAVDDKSVWSQMNELQELPANNIAEAASNAFNNDHLIKAYGYNADGSFDDSTAVRLTHALGSNQHDWLVLNEWNNPASGRIRNIISPTQIPRSNGLPSAAYQMRLFRGLPSSGNEILTTEGFDGIEVGFFVSAANSLVMFSDADKPASANDPIYAVFYQYVGATGGGSFSGNTVLLESPDGSWRVRNAYPHLLFERREFDANDLPVWNTFASMGNSIATDGVKLHRPYDIAVDMSSTLNEVSDFDIDPDFKSVFRVAGANEAFIYGNTEKQTVIESLRGTDIKHAVAVREELEIENRPLDDLEVVLDCTDEPEDGSFEELSWISNINYTQDADFIRFNKIAFEVLESSDDVSGAPLRVSVELPNGELLQENLTFTSLNAGINGGFNLKTGFEFNTITPKYTDSREAVTVTRIQIAKGHRVKLSAGMYDYTDPDDGSTKQQLVPRQKSLVEFSNDARILDESNLTDVVYDKTGIFLDQGVNAYNPDFSDQQYPLISGAEHTNAYNAVLGNYTDETYIASGEGGVKVLYNDPSTRTQFWTTDTKTQISDNKTPQFFKEVTELEIDLSGVFTDELDEVSWDIVNSENFTLLLRNEQEDPVGYRVEIFSTVVDYKFQESQDKYSFADRNFRQGYTFNPTIDLEDPEFVKLKLPRSRYTVNRESPRKVKYIFSEPVKVYGSYKDIVDPSDPTTGTFVPHIKSDVERVFEEVIVSGDSLEERVDELQGDVEYQEALQNNMPTLHTFPAKLALADKDGEWLFFGDASSLYTDQDEFQYLFTTGSEAYFELTDQQGAFQNSNSVFKFNPVVVGIPTDKVFGFEVSFGWHDSFNDNGSLKYGEWTMFIDSNGRGFDSKITMNIPVNASVNWRFRRRRDGSFSYVATPFNDNLSSTWLGSNNDLTDEMPVNPNPPV